MSCSQLPIAYESKFPRVFYSILAYKWICFRGLSVSKFAYRAWNWSFFLHTTPCCAISLSKTTIYGIRNGTKLYFGTWPINESCRFPIFENMGPIYRFKEFYWWFNLELRRDSCMFMLKKILSFLQFTKWWIA